MTTGSLTATICGFRRRHLITIAAAVLMIAIPAITTFFLTRNGEETAATLTINPEVQRQINDLRARIDALKGLVEANPGYTVAVKELADAYFDIGSLQQADGREWDSKRSYEQAVDKYERYLSLSPNDEGSTLYLSLAQLNLGNSDEAIRIMEEQSRLRPGSQNTWYVMGWVYAQSGRATESEWAYTKALNIDPASPIGQQVKQFLDQDDGTINNGGNPLNPHGY